MTWASWLLSLAAPVASRVLVSLGIGTVTFVGLQAALNAALNQAKAAAGGLSGDVMSFVAMSGGFVAMSIIAGGAVTSVSMIALKKLALRG